jgi:hypothetical protein
MKNLDCKEKGILNTGFIDPNRVNKVMVNDNPKETEDNFLHFLVKQEYKSKILFPYNSRWVLLSCHIHFSLLDVKCNWWVTDIYKPARSFDLLDFLKIEPDFERVEIFDLLEKELDQYESFIDMLQR